jgi:hypothetical protein
MQGINRVRENVGQSTCAELKDSICGEVANISRRALLYDGEIFQKVRELFIS